MENKWILKKFHGQERNTGIKEYYGLKRNNRDNKEILGIIKNL